MLAKKLGEEGQALVQMRQARKAEESLRSAYEDQRMYQKAAADWNRQDQAQAQKRAQAMAMAEENRRVAELKKRQKFAEQVKDNIIQEKNIKQNKYTIQSSQVR